MSSSVNESDFLNKGKELLETGNIEEAVKYLDKAYANDPDNDKLLNMLGLAYFKSGRLENAYQIYRKLINKNPQNATLRLNMGVLLYKKKEYQLALEELMIAEKLEPSNSNINYYKGMCFEQEKDFNRALIEYEKSGSQKNIDRVREKLQTRKSKFKIKDDSVELKSVTTEDILIKHFGSRAAGLEDIEDDADIDRVLSEKQSSPSGDEEDDGLFDASKLAEEFDLDNTEEESLQKPEPEKQDDTGNGADAENMDHEEEIPELNIDEETEMMVKQLYSYDQNISSDDSFDEKVEEFLKDHQQKEDEEYKTGLQDTNDNILADEKQYQEEREEEDGESESLPESVERAKDKDAETEDSKVIITSTSEEKKGAFRYSIKEPLSPVSVEMHPIITLEAMTREYLIKDDTSKPVIQIENDIIIYSFQESYLYKRGSLVGYCGNISEATPDDDKDYEGLQKTSNDEFRWVFGEGRLFIKLKRRKLIPVRLFGDVFTVNMNYIIGSDGNIVRDLIRVPSDNFSLVKLEGKGYLFLSLDNEPVSFSIEDGQTLHCKINSFLGYMGINLPALSRASAVDVCIDQDESRQGRKDGPADILEVNGPGVVFLTKGSF